MVQEMASEVEEGLVTPSFQDLEEILVLREALGCYESKVVKALKDLDSNKSEKVVWLFFVATYVFLLIWFDFFMLHMKPCIFLMFYAKNYATLIYMFKTLCHNKQIQDH